MNTKNLKPFNLQAALNGEPVMLRDGSKAFVRHYEAEQKVDDGFRLWGVVVYEWSACTVMTWSTQGRFDRGLEDNSLDIIGMWPKTRIINGFEVPAPEKVAPKRFTVCFHANVSNDYFHISYVWQGDKSDLRALKRGLVFLSEEGSIANAKAMLGINPYEESEE